jgi:hypothetical protein
MKKFHLEFALGAGLIMIGLLTNSSAGAQNFRTRDECINALASRCMSLMDRNAKISCFKGNQVYCQNFPEVKLTPEQRGITVYHPEDMRQEGFTRSIDPRDYRRTR